MNAEELRNQLEELRQENARLAALQAQQYPTASVNRVAVKLPPFWSERPSLWFSQVDSQFAISGITSEETKFNYVVAQLDTRYAAEVEDIITNPPPTERYKHLRAKLVERLSISEEQRVRQLINEEELGDRKPSQFLRHLRSLAGTTTLQDNILRQLWLRRLPSHAQAILTAQSELPLDKVAELADKIVEVQPAPSQFVHAVATTNNKKELDVLAAIEALTKQVSELCAKRPQRSRSRSRNRSNVELTNGKGWCWYHSTYGEKAAKCKAPCKYQENSNDSQ
ncbi:uncharacterized protein LOC126908202 [Daktulosphaira vitifoliae]|uniref:uncharacterized protein LOC126894642 n=1 Tax=Daktulosphaira vitifoliae TaxID=58002 RepID=UPI0021A9BCEE|nr:uncharacterized protein LOC126894642 [Daktulosphaira vitifoliae]XP_050540363.1 uncharacterized protein LOC126905005 [Daktulosphaira vitifoliae]XP_050546070.1 uncharacterized protein LOC126908202 [Daktulosphaira vitifoliae]